MDSSLKELVTEVIREIKQRHSTSDLKGIPILNAYRNLLKQTLGKDESSVEALMMTAVYIGGASIKYELIKSNDGVV